MTDDFDHTKPTKEQRAEMRAKQEQRVKDAEATWQRDIPIRAAFHSYLKQNGYGLRETPPPGSSYKSSMIDALWHCWLTSTLYQWELHD
jgi:hypothetical protein